MAVHMQNINAKIPNTANSANETSVIIKNTSMASVASIFVKLSIQKVITVPVKPTIKPVTISIRTILTIIISLTPIVKIRSNRHCTNPGQQKEQKIINKSGHLLPPEIRASFDWRNLADKGTQFLERLPKTCPRSSVQYHSTSSCTFFTSRLRYHCAFSRSCR